MNTPESRSIRGIVAVIALLLLAPLVSRADTYSVVGSWSEHQWLFTGLDQSGNVYLLNSLTSQYSTLLPTGVSTFSATLPSFVSDRGSQCSASLPGFTYVFGEICNGSRVAFLSSPAGGPDTSLYMYSGTGTAQFVTADNHGDLIAMNSLGDIVFDDGFNDIGYYAVDLTTLSATPEPSSLLLLATGLAGAAMFFARRRLFA